jgi:hypothetical protein
MREFVICFAICWIEKFIELLKVSGSRIESGMTGGASGSWLELAGR